MAMEKLHLIQNEMYHVITMQFKKWIKVGKMQSYSSLFVTLCATVKLNEFVYNNKNKYILKM